MDAPLDPDGSFILNGSEKYSSLMLKKNYTISIRFILWKLKLKYKPLYRLIWKWHLNYLGGWQLNLHNKVLFNCIYYALEIWLLYVSVEQFCKMEFIKFTVDVSGGLCDDIKLRCSFHCSFYFKDLVDFMAMTLIVHVGCDCSRENGNTVYVFAKKDSKYIYTG